MDLWGICRELEQESTMGDSEDYLSIPQFQWEEEDIFPAIDSSGDVALMLNPTAAVPPGNMITCSPEASENKAADEANVFSGNWDVAGGVESDAGDKNIDFSYPIPTENQFTGKSNFQIPNKLGSPKTKLSIYSQPSASSSIISFQSGTAAPISETEAIACTKEMIYRAAAFRPVDSAVEKVKKPKRKNVKISEEPQTAAARRRREKISEKIRVLQKLVPGGSKMDTASMLDEAANYLKFLRSQVKLLQVLHGHGNTTTGKFPPVANISFSMQRPLEFFVHNSNPKYKK